MANSSRKGFNGKSSGLFREAIRIIREMRNATNGKYPKYAVRENVPGAFNSNSGGDFREVLREIAATVNKTVFIPRPPNGKWATAGEYVDTSYSIAWRTLDAQYWGVPQRRRRIFLVADFNTERAPEILFERESVYRNFTAGDIARETTAEVASDGTFVASEYKPTVYPIDTRNAVKNCNNKWDNCGLGIGQKGEASYSLTSSYTPDAAVLDARGNRADNYGRPQRAYK